MCVFTGPFLTFGQAYCPDRSLEDLQEPSISKLELDRRFFLPFFLKKYSIPRHSVNKVRICCADIILCHNHVSKKYKTFLIK
jgi:hypothetical protein